MSKASNSVYGSSDMAPSACTLVQYQFLMAHIMDWTNAHFECHGEVIQSYLQFPRISHSASAVMSEMIVLVTEHTQSLDKHMSLYMTFILQ